MDEHRLEAQGLQKSFRSPGGRLDVLCGVDFAPAPGQVTAVVGASGSGKSTLLHVLGTLDRPTGGRVLYGGEDVFRWDDTRLARFRNRSIGFIFQFHHLMPEFTAVENVMMPALIAGRSRGEAGREALSLLTRIGLAERAEHRPAELSGGEQQRVAVARALVNRPMVVLADEPSGNLDQGSSRSLQDLIFELARTLEETFVIVTHDERLAARADRVLVLEDGRLRDRAPDEAMPGVVVGQGMP
jgi:lipoprotein-releasing system ATP-binding protein